MIKNHATVLFVILAGYVGTSGCSQARAGAPAGYQGVVELDDRVLSFELPGKVSKLSVARGARVTSGAQLASIDDALERATREARSSDARAADAQTKLLRSGSRPEDIRATAAQLKAAKAQIALLERDLARTDRLIASGTLPAARRDETDAQLVRVRGERDALAQRLAAQRNGARVEEVESASSRSDAAAALVKLEDTKLARHTLTAPIAGVITEIHVDEGEVVAAGAPVISLADATHPYADVFVPEGGLFGIRLGTPCKVRVDSSPSAVPCTTEHVSERTEFTPRYLFSERERPNLVVRVRVRIDDPEQKLHAGIPAFVTFEATP